MASSRSSALPCGIPSTTSISATSASSLAAIQCAAVAPTLPAPTMLTLFRISSPVNCAKYFRLHVSDDARGKLARAHLRCAGELAFEVVRDTLLLDRLLHRHLDHLCRFLPADEI